MPIFFLQLAFWPRRLRINLTQSDLSPAPTVNLHRSTSLDPWVYCNMLVQFWIIIYYFYQFMEVIKGDSPLLATAK
jgi:hypothetical protein